MGKYTAARAVLFLVLAVILLIFAISMEPSWERNAFYTFAVLDLVWGGVLLNRYLKSKK